jgi:enediyne biosynthesis protein E4
MPHHPRRFIRAFLLAAGAASFSTAIGAAERDISALPVIHVPAHDERAAALPARKAAQEKTRGEFGVFTGFTFTDRQPESGITFRHHIVDDAGKHYKAVHYDHGNGIVAADVDGDGREDIYFVNQRGGSELWKNLGGGKFQNITGSAGVGLKDKIAVSASFVDINNDGAPDLYVTTVRSGNVMFLNDGHGHFTDITKDSGLGYVGHSSGAVFFDYDNDGLPDLFLVNVGKYTTDYRGEGGYYIGMPDAFHGHMHPDREEYSVLYKNVDGRHFRDVSEETGLRDASWSGDASFTDLNGDGYLDLYVLNMQGENHFYMNQGGKRFEDRTAEAFPRTSWGAMGIKWFDYDNDGKMDLFITDMHSDMSAVQSIEEEKKKSRIAWSGAMLGPHEGANSIFGNSFFHNLGNGKFEEISDAIGVEDYWPWGPSIGDLNADGYEDIFIAASMNYPFHYAINSVLLNDRGKKFRDAEFLVGVEPRRGGRTEGPAFDLDCSGDDKDLKLCEGRTGRATVMGALGTRSAVIFDIDGDGDLDIVTNELNSVPQVLVSDLAQKKKIHWAKVDLVGTKSNRNGLGATVRLTAAGKTYTRSNDGKSGYLSQSILPLYFGLGDATTVSKIEVDWPSGKRQVLTENLKADSRIRVTEPK